MQPVKYFHQGTLYDQANNLAVLASSCDGLVFTKEEILEHIADEGIHMRHAGLIGHLSECMFFLSLRRGLFFYKPNLPGGDQVRVIQTGDSREDQALYRWAIEPRPFPD